MTYLSHVEVEDSGLFVPSPELEQERRVAVFDLQEGSDFRIADVPGPYRLRLGMEDGRALFRWHAEGGTQGEFTLALGSLAQAVKDYRTLCEAYAEAVKFLPPTRIAEIDAARREIHTEAARQLQGRLAERAEMDETTARRLFTLICAMSQPA